ncbi:MAG TPA: hypothetical protein VFZ03_03395 [Dongiaceae bacterium]
MATRRPIYRKQEPRSISKIGFLLCMVLAGTVLLVPTGGDVLRAFKVKVRDLVMTSTLVDLDACVVTADHVLACTSDAAGVPLEVALRQMKDNAAVAAEEKRQRQKAEGTVRQLAVEIDRLTAQSTQRQLADQPQRFLPPFATDVTPTARTGDAAPAGDAGTISIMKAATKPQSADAAASEASDPFSPPDEAE